VALQLSTTLLLPFQELQNLSLSNLAIQGCVSGAGTLILPPLCVDVVKGLSEHLAHIFSKKKTSLLTLSWFLGFFSLYFFLDRLASYLPVSHVAFKLFHCHTLILYLTINYWQHDTNTPMMS